MNNSSIRLLIISVSVIAGCSDATEREQAVVAKGSSQRGEQAGQMQPEENQPTPAAHTGETTAESSKRSNNTSKEAPAQEVVADSAAPTEEMLRHFDAGIAAYQANNIPLAFQEFEAAAKKGHADSQFNLALMYEQGIGLASDLTQAVAWYQRAASQGNSAAQFNLGVLHENGRGTEVDFGQANKWYRSASVQGDPLAIGNLGMLYIRGDGVPVNKIAGVALLFLSATLDPSPNNHARRNITGTRGLSTDMIAAAQKLSGELSTADNLLVPLDKFLKQSGGGQ